MSRGPSRPSTPITGKRPLLSDEEEQLEKKMRTGVEEMEGTRPTTEDKEEEELATILRKIYIHDWRILRTEMKDNKSDFAILPKTTTAQRMSQEKAKREGRLMDGTKRDPKTLVPKEYWNYLKVFDEKASY